MTVAMNASVVADTTQRGEREAPQLWRGGGGVV
jgi:hypothetical protein